MRFLPVVAEERIESLEILLVESASAFALISHYLDGLDTVHHDVLCDEEIPEITLGVQVVLVLLKIGEGVTGIDLNIYHS